MNKNITIITIENSFNKLCRVICEEANQTLDSPIYIDVADCNVVETLNISTARAFHYDNFEEALYHFESIIGWLIQSEDDLIEFIDKYALNPLDEFLLRNVIDDLKLAEVASCKALSDALRWLNNTDAINALIEYARRYDTYATFVHLCDRYGV